jgi:hypothetical protein
MLLAELAAKSAETPSLWASVPFTSVVLLIAGGLITLAVQRVLLRLGLIHRYAELLWQEKLKAYQGLLTDAGNLVSMSMMLTGPKAHMQMAKYVMQYFATAIRLGALCSEDAHKAMELFGINILGVAAKGMDGDTQIGEVDAKMMELFNKLVNAVRDDLSINPLSDTPKDLFPPMPSEVVTAAADVDA